MIDAIEALRRGGVIIYPTETLYALGGNGFDPDVAARVVALKGRPAGKPLPLIIGSPDQLRLVTDHVDSNLERLAREFWPGPLSVLVRARGNIPRLVTDEEGYTSLRLTPHPIAAALCREIEAPLVAPALPEAIDPFLVDSVDAVIRDRPHPAGGKPSTLIRIVGPNRIELLREGTIAKDLLEKHGFEVQ